AEAEQIVQHENLAVALGAGADADSGDAEFAGDERRELAGDAFENNGEGPGGFHGSRVANELFGGIGRLAVNFKAAHGVQRLWSEADVSHDRNFRFGETRDEFKTALAAFDFDRFSAGFLDEANRIADGLADFGMIAAEGHVRDDERALSAFADGAGMVEHLVD